MTFFVQTPDEEEEEVEEEGASLDDDLLAELTPVEDEEEDIDPLTEGFGEVPEEEEKAIEKASEKTDDDDEDAENFCRADSRQCDGAAHRLSGEDLRCGAECGGGGGDRADSGGENGSGEALSAERKGGAG